MCDVQNSEIKGRTGNTIPVTEAVGMVLAHDITEIRQDDFKGRAFKKGHIVKEEDISHLQRLGKENLFVLNIADDEVHEDDAAYALANALMGEGVKMEGEPKEGKINILADRDGLLKINRPNLAQFNMLGDVMCATLHNNTVVRKGQIVAGTRVIPLVVKKAIVEEAVRIARGVKNYPPMSPLTKGGIKEGSGIIEVKEIRKPKVGVVITGNEVYHGRIKDAFAPIIRKKIDAFNGEIVGIYYAPDNEEFIEARLRELIETGADLLITTGGMSVDPDDVTRFAIRRLGATDITYGSAALPGAMFLVAYVQKSTTLQPPLTKGGIEGGVSSELQTQNSKLIPILGIPACGMYHKTTIFDLILPRVLSGERIGRKELAELGHGGLCLNCKECRYPVCPFGK
ncbi:MAG: molybdopterin-binding protein [Nitrospirae bacterium]|jgi:molybdenum cofactor synthesis domain-containing protein|nr:molybdopterin-binding protein [Nitrospirota bacterium]